MKMNWVKLKPNMPIIAIMVLALILRLVILLHYGEFWYDEMFNFVYSQRAWPEGLKYWLLETNPPLHLLILKIWFYVFPTTEFFTRLPGILAGTASVWVIYRLGKDMYNRNVGLLSAFYLAVHPYHIFWSSTARIYVFLMLFTTLSTRFFYCRYFQTNSQPTSVRHRSISALINFLLIFSHLSSLFFFAGQFIILAMFKGKRDTWQWIKDNLLPFAVGGLWISASFLLKNNNEWGRAWFFIMQYNIKDYIQPFINLTVGQFTLVEGSILLFAILIGWIILLKKEVEHKKNQVIILTIFVLIPMLIAFVFNIWQIKFFLNILPLFLIIICRFLENSLYKLVMAFIIISAICIIGFINLWHSLPLSNLDYLAQFMSKTPPQTIMVYNNHNLILQLRHYLPELSQRSIPLTLFPGLKEDDGLVTKNYVFKMLTEKEKDDWYQNNRLDKYTSLVLLEDDSAYMNNLTDTFIEHGWKLKQTPESARLSSKYNLYWYEKN